MKKFFFIVLTIILALAAIYYVFIYYASFSEGYRAGQLVKFSKKGVIFKTWEGELSFGVSEAQRFEFSVEKKNKELIKQLSEMQGEEVKLTYFERFGTFPWLGDKKYFGTEVEVKSSYKPDTPIEEQEQEEDSKSTLQEILR